MKKILFLMLPYLSLSLAFATRVESSPEQVIELQKIVESNLAFPLKEKRSMQLVKIKTRDQVNQPFLYTTAANPKANLIILVGGEGNLEFSDKNQELTIGRSKNVLVLVKFLFVNRGINIALLDLPSTLSSELTDMFRNGLDHVADLDAVADYMKKKSPQPVWIVGISRGTMSVANALVNTKGKIYGGILSSNITSGKYRKDGSSVLDRNLDGVKGKVLVLAHKDDACRNTPPSGAKQIADKLVNAKKVELKYLEGGAEPSGPPCEPMARHTFVGIEELYANTIADFILANSSD